MTKLHPRLKVLYERLLAIGIPKNAQQKEMQRKILWLIYKVANELGDKEMAIEAKRALDRGGDSL